MKIWLIVPACLFVVECRVFAAVYHELVVRALIGQSTLIEDQDAFGATYGGEAVGDED